MSKIKSINSIIGATIVFMAQTPYQDIVSNFSTYLPTFVLEKLPTFVQNKSFDKYMLIIGLILILTTFAPYVYRLLIPKLTKIGYTNTNQTILRTDSKASESPFLPLSEAMGQYINSSAKCQNVKVNLNESIMRYESASIDPRVSKKFVPKEVRSLLTYILNDRLTLYGYKIVASKEIPPSLIVIKFLPWNVDFLRKDSWGNDYSTLYDIKKNIVYIKLFVNREEFVSFLNKLKLNP